MVVFILFEGLIDVVSGAKNMKHFYIFWLNVFVVLGGQSVVDKTTVVEGQTFTITCDHRHVNGTMPSCRFLVLEIFKVTGGGIPKIFITVQPGEFKNINIPSHWTKDCKNPKNPSDVTQFHCKLIVNNAKIADSGQYECRITLDCTGGHGTTFEGFSDVVVTKENSVSSSNFGERTVIGLCLITIAATQLKWHDHHLNG